MIGMVGIEKRHDIRRGRSCFEMGQTGKTGAPVPAPRLDDDHTAPGQGFRPGAVGGSVVNDDDVSHMLSGEIGEHPGERHDLVSRGDDDVGDQ